MVATLYTLVFLACAGETPDARCTPVITVSGLVDRDACGTAAHAIGSALKVIDPELTVGRGQCRPVQNRQA